MDSSGSQTVTDQQDSPTLLLSYDSVSEDGNGSVRRASRTAIVPSEGTLEDSGSERRRHRHRHNSNGNSSNSGRRNQRSERSNNDYTNRYRNFMNNRSNPNNDANQGDNILIINTSSNSSLENSVDNDNPGFEIVVPILYGQGSSDEDDDTALQVRLPQQISPLYQQSSPNLTQNDAFTVD